jgi:hypothetical protein
VFTLVIAVAATSLGYVFGATGAPRNAGPASSTTASNVSIPSTSTSTSTSAVAVTTSRVDQSRLADLVPGFEGTLVAEIGSWYLAVWPAHMRIPSVNPVDPGMPFEFDPSSHLPARLVRAATELEYERSLLLVGSHPIRVAGSGGLLISMGAAALNVRSFAWHLSQPRMLAWIEGAPDTQTQEETLTLHVGEVGDDGVFVHSPLLATLPGNYRVISMLAWDTWGFLVSGFDNAGSASLSLLAPDGSLAWSRALGPQSMRTTAEQVSLNGDILLVNIDHATDEMEIALTDISGQAPRVVDWGLSFGLVRLAPDGQRVAYISGDGRRAEVVIRHVDGTVLQAVPLGNSRVWDLQWTPDGRFVLAPGELEPFGSGGHVLFFVDSEDGSSHVVRFDGWVQFPRVLLP